MVCACRRRYTALCLIAFIFAACTAAAAEHPDAEGPVIVPRPNAKELAERIERALDEKRSAERQREQDEGKVMVFVITLVDQALLEHAAADVSIRLNGEDVADVLRAPGKFTFVVADDVVLNKEVRDTSKLEIVAQGKALRTLPMSPIVMSAVRKVDLDEFREQIRLSQQASAEAALDLDREAEENHTEHVTGEAQVGEAATADAGAGAEDADTAQSDTNGDTVDSMTEKKHQEDYVAFMELMSELHTNGLSPSHFAEVRAMANEGNTFAMTNLASIYLAGDFEGVARNVTRGVELLRKAAATGNADAQAQLGFLHASGVYSSIAPKNAGLAMLYWQFASHGGSQYAKMALAFRYFTGTDVAEDCDAAALLYEEVAYNALRTEMKRKREVLRSAHPNSASGAVADVTPPTPQEIAGLGRTRLRDDMPPQLTAEHRDVVQYYMHAARRGDAHAQVIVGNLYFYGGAGVPQDLAHARALFQRAADAGRMDALAHLGFMDLRAGRNLTAVEYLTKAASGNNKMGHHGLGLVRLHGIGVDRNIQLARFHFKKAAEARVPEAMYNLGVLHYEGSLVPLQRSVAYEYFVHAANYGHQKARYMVGRMHLKGTEPADPDCSKAARQFKAVAEQGVWNRIMGRALRAHERGDADTAAYRYAQAAHAGIEVAQYNAAFLYDSRLPAAEGGERDAVLDSALELYRMSAAQGHADGAAKSMLRVGDLVYAERGDFATAADAYERAGRFKSAEALFNLGVMHATGRGLKMDAHMAKRYFDEARAADDRSSLPTALALVLLRYSSELKTVASAGVRLLRAAGLADGVEAAKAWIAKAPRAQLGPDNVLLALLLLALALIVNARQRLRVARQEEWEDEEEAEQGQAPQRVL